MSVAQIPEMDRIAFDVPCGLGGRKTAETVLQCYRQPKEDRRGLLTGLNDCYAPSGPLTDLIAPSSTSRMPLADQQQYTSCWAYAEALSSRSGHLTGTVVEPIVVCHDPKVVDMPRTPKEKTT